MEDRIIMLEGQVRQLTENWRTGPTGAATGQKWVANPLALATPPSPAIASEGGSSLPVHGGASAAAKALNPDISVIGDFASAGHYPTPPVLLVAIRSVTDHA